VAGHTGNAGLHGLVNNAGIGVFGPLELIPVEQFRRLLEVNVTGQLAVTQALLPLLRRARGRIIMIGSIGARFTPPFVGPLAASKSALATIGEALRQELAPWDIRVVVVEPASVRTEAVGKLERDARQLMDRATPTGRALYQDAFRRLVATFAAQHEKGSPPEVVAEAVAHALTHHNRGPATWSARTPAAWPSSPPRFRPGAGCAAPQAGPSARAGITRAHPTTCRPDRRR
jgi:NAD(P)-dependent dehydrogenase (short-subunit alcohol dehydrogenase family)